MTIEQQQLLQKIISGGQTGADQAGLEFAFQKKLEYGGHLPAGRKAENGIVPEKYVGMEETTSANYLVRTELNVCNADATIICTTGPLRTGSARTAEFCTKHHKPFLHLDFNKYSEAAAGRHLAEFLKRYAVVCLNVAGSRASKNPRIFIQTYQALEDAQRLLLDKSVPSETQAAPTVKLYLPKSPPSLQRRLK